MLPVYIQKKINGEWCTLLTIDSTISDSTLNHLCKQHCKDLYRISLEKTDDMLPEPQNFSEKETISIWDQNEKTFKENAKTILEVRKRYKSGLLCCFYMW